MAYQRYCQITIRITKVNFSEVACVALYGNRRHAVRLLRLNRYLKFLTFFHLESRLTKKKWLTVEKEFQFWQNTAGRKSPFFSYWNSLQGTVLAVYVCKLTVQRKDEDKAAINIFIVNLEYICFYCARPLMQQYQQALYNTLLQNRPIAAWLF
jgi:hypothetical protein